MKRWLFPLAGVMLLAGVLVWAMQRGPQAAPAASLLLATQEYEPEFARAVDVRPFQFPLDHGPHPAYQTEWWYFTGNLETQGGEHVGFQLTFFRRSLEPQASARSSAFATDQIYFAHFAITDVAGSAHAYAERFSRGAAGLAGASGSPFRVWVEDWSLEAVDPDGGAVRLRAQEGSVGFDLTLRATKPIVAHGDRGLSPKSEAQGNASYYLSYTRMATEGTVTLDGKPVGVQGESWFDHEWSTSALGPEAVGWDWFGLQLSDGRELMLFQIRRADGSIEPVSGGTLIEPDGATRALSMQEVEIQVLKTWRSPETDAVYPASWRIVIPSASIDLSVEPWLADQEMRVSFVYWEGAARVGGTSAGRKVTGNGYVELTGYFGSMQGVL